MLDQIEHHIANRLSQKHNYPFAQNIYIDIFRSFSHFPIPMAEVGIKGPGETITYLALVVQKCFDLDGSSLIELYEKALAELRPRVEYLFPQDCSVETLLGSALYLCHPSSIKNDLSHRDIPGLFSEKQLYEFELKKKTIAIYIL